MGSEALVSLRGRTKVKASTTSTTTKPAVGTTKPAAEGKKA